jgi:hypothetical protein
MKPFHGAKVRRGAKVFLTLKLFLNETKWWAFVEETTMAVLESTVSMVDRTEVYRR